MKKLLKALIVIGLLGLCAAGVSVLVRKNSENKSSAYSGGGSSNKDEPPITAIYVQEEDIEF